MHNTRSSTAYREANGEISVALNSLKNRRPLRPRRRTRTKRGASGAEPGENFSVFVLTLTVIVKVLRRVINWYDPYLRLIFYRVAVR